MNRCNVILTLSLLAVLSACAEQQQSQQVRVSPLEFKNYNCKQLAKEMKHTSAKYDQLTRENSDNGAQALLNTALTAYAISQDYITYSESGSDPQLEYLAAKSEALHQASIEKNCD